MQIAAGEIEEELAYGNNKADQTLGCKADRGAPRA
jgi:hypothetical protein